LGATHDVLSASFAKANGLLDLATPSRRIISGFDGSKSHAAFEIKLRLDPDPTPTTFIVTTLKDAYNDILGMPWII
jgi:hypothetical protein